MTLSGPKPIYMSKVYWKMVLIPLLVDDPLWVMRNFLRVQDCLVLIPLLVDDPLWVVFHMMYIILMYGLNPSFSG